MNKMDKITIEEPFDISQDVNQNGIIDDDELTESQRLMKKQHKLNNMKLIPLYKDFHVFQYHKNKKNIFLI